MQLLCNFLTYSSLLIASAAVLQDTGYTIEESEVPLGVIVASRDRDVTKVFKNMLVLFQYTL